MATLTEKQQRFCNEYLIDLNATQAAIRAGYSGRNARNIASENLAKPNIQKYIAERMSEKKSSLIASQDEVLEFLTAVMRGEEKDEQLITNAMGEIEVKEVKRQALQLKAAEQLAKRYEYCDKEEKQAKLEKLKAETARIKGEDPEADKQDDGFIAALRGEVEDIWDEK